MDRTALKFGSAAHRLSELVADGISLPEAFSQTSEEEKLTRTEIDLLDIHKDSATIFERRMGVFKERYSMGLDQRELELGLGDTLQVSSYSDKGAMLRGKLDRVILSEDEETAVVIDLKTSKRATLEYAMGQLDFYTTLVFGNYPKVTTVKNGLYFLTLGKMMWAPLARRESYDMSESNNIVTRINTASSEFFASLAPVININPLCKWCVYREICKKERRVRRKAARQQEKA